MKGNQGEWVQGRIRNSEFGMPPTHPCSRDGPSTSPRRAVCGARVPRARPNDCAGETKHQMQARSSTQRRVQLSAGKTGTASAISGNGHGSGRYQRQQQRSESVISSPSPRPRPRPIGRSHSGTDADADAGGSNIQHPASAGWAGGNSEFRIPNSPLLPCSPAFCRQVLLYAPCRNGLFASLYHWS